MATQDLPRSAAHPFYMRLNQILDQHELLRRAALDNCDLLPTGTSAEGYNGEKTRQMTAITLGKQQKKGFDRSVDRSVELHFDYCFQQSVYGGWVAG